jgi:phosphatidate cytidylyltransferase
MLSRLMYGAVAITAVFTAVVLDALISDTTATGLGADLRRKGTCIPVLLALLVAAGAVELGRLMRSAGLRPLTRWAALCCVVLMLTPWLVSGILLPRYPASVTGSPWQLAALAIALGTVGCGMLVRRELTGALGDVAATWGIILYAGLLPSFATQLRCHPFLHGPDGAWLLLIILAVVKVSDIGAYFIGTACGRHRLIPWVSPGKSVEGAFGGLLSSVAVALLFWFAYEWTRPADANAEQVPLLHSMTKLFHALTFWQVIIFGTLMSITGQLGDLLESVFKRAARAKDSASLVPAFGGVLDIIDSPAIAVPVAWFLLTCLWPVV